MIFKKFLFDNQQGCAPHQQLVLILTLTLTSKLTAELSAVTKEPGLRFLGLTKEGAICFWVA